jgi:DNA polymerase III, delta subunit
MTITDSNLIKQIKAGELCSLYLLFGEELYMSSGVLSMLKSACVGDFADFNFTSVDGKTLSAGTYSELLDFLNTPPMMSERRLAVIKNYDAAKTGGKDMIEFLSKLPSDAVLVFHMETPLPPKRGARWNDFIDLCAKVGLACEFKHKGINEIVPILCTRAKKLGAILPPNVAAHMVRRCGASLEILITDLAKLCAYAKSESRDIAAADVDVLTTPLENANIFELAKQILQKNAHGALYMIKVLKHQGEDELGISAVLGTAIIDFYRAKVIGSSREICALWNYRGREFAVDRALSTVYNIPLPVIERWLKILLAADTDMKGGSKLPKRQILETAVIEMISC